MPRSAAILKTDVLDAYIIAEIAREEEARRRADDEARPRIHIDPTGGPERPDGRDGTLEPDGTAIGDGTATGDEPCDSPPGRRGDHAVLRGDP